MEETGLTLVKPSLSVSIVENLNPFRLDQRRTVELTPLANESIGAIVARAGFDADEYRISLNGERIDSADIWHVVIKPGEQVVLFPRAAGGGRVWEMVSMLALTVLAGAITAGAGGIGFLAFLGPFLTAGQASLIAGALGVAGSMLISWAFSPGQPGQPAFSTTYDPTGPKGLAQPGVPVPKGYGVMGWCGNVVSSFVNFDGANAYINVLVCYGWGQAASISNVLINLKPISSFLNCTYQQRLGYNVQTAIDGFDKTVNGYPQEIDLLVSSGPTVVPGTGTNVQGLEITVKFPAGLYRITNDSNYVPIKFIYKVEVSVHGADEWVAPLFPADGFLETIATFVGSVETWPLWVVNPTDRFAGTGLVYAYDNGPHTAGDTWSSTETVDIVNLDTSTTSTSVTFKGVWEPCDPNTTPARCTAWWQGYRVVEADTLSAYFDTTSVYGLAAGQWDTRVTKIGYCQDNNDDVIFADSTDAQHVCDGWLWNINEVFWSNLTYPNMILIGVQALATSQMSGEDIQVMATITHDLGADTTIPGQLAGFEHDNPALVAWDVLTNPLYGMNVSSALIDIPAFVAWAEFNDETVTNQDSTSARRHIFAGVFDQPGDAWKTLQTIGNMSRAAVVQQGMRYSVVLDAPAAPVQLFTVGNTKKDSFTETWLALDDRCTLIECDFSDADRTYRMDLPVSVMTEADINSGLQPKITRTRMVGCTSRDQAWRWAYYHLLSTKLSLRTVQISAPVEACCCGVGSVIAVQSDVVQWAQGGRIQPGSTTNTVNVERADLTFAEASGWTVSVQHPLVSRGTAVISSVVGLVVTMTAAVGTARILKAVAPDGTEYIVTGSGGTAITLASTSSVAAAVALAAGQTMTLYDANVIDNLDVFGITVSLPTDKGFGGTVISIGSGSFSAVPTADSAWAYGQSAGYQPAKLFRVVSIKKSGDFNFDIGALEYNAEQYEDVTPNYGEIVGVPNGQPFITNLSLTEIYQSGLATGSSSSAVVAVGWQNGNTAVGAQVSVASGVNGKFNVIGSIAGQGCTFVGYIGTTYQVQIIGFDWQGNLLGTPVSGSITVVASTNAPANVTGFTGAPTSTETVLTWTAVSGADHYEIRYADQSANSDWVTSEVLWDGSATTWTDTTVRSGIYMIVAVSSLSTGSVESVTPATWQVNPPQYQLSNTVILNPPGLVLAEVFYSTGDGMGWPAPSGSIIGPGGVITSIPSASFAFLGSPAASSTYYAYAYITPTAGWAVFPAVSGTNLPDTAPSTADAASAIADGVAVWQVMWAFSSGSDLVGTTLTQLK